MYLQANGTQIKRMIMINAEKQILKNHNDPYPHRSKWNADYADGYDKHRKIKYIINNQRHPRSKKYQHD
jgi:hypothetical protein